MTDSKKKSTKGKTTAAAGGGFDMTEMFKMYDPEAIAQMFDPQKLFAQMPGMAGGMDMDGLFRKNQASYEAMVEANKAAAETYKDMLEKQMEVFTRLTAEAQGMADRMASPADSDAAQKNAEIYAEATEKAFALMQEMAEAAQQANQESFERIKVQVTAAINDLKTA